MRIHATPNLNLILSAFHMTATKTARTPTIMTWASAPLVLVLDSWTIA